MRNNQKGGISSVILIVVLVVFLGGVGLFAAVTFNQKQKAQNHVDEIVAGKVVEAKASQKADDQKQFSEDSKKPYKTYTGPEANGSVSYQYPKTWSGYVDESSNSQPINGYFYPDVVPGLNSGKAYALRTELIGQTYSSVLQQLTSPIKSGSLKASAYMPPKMTKVSGAQVGTLLTGTIDQQHQGTMLVIPVRDKTLKIYTQSTVFNNDFNNVVLKSLVFNP